MLKSLLFVTLGLLAGLGVSQIVRERSPVGAPADMGIAAGSGSSELSARLQALEARLAAEVQVRETLTDEVAFLSEELAGLQARLPTGPAAAAAIEAEGVTGFRGRRGRFADPVERAAERRESLVAAGFGLDQADAILRREGELRMEAMYRRYEARRGDGNGEQTATRVFGGLPNNPLREELGDADYDRYLYATGQSNRVRVAEVIETSPAAQAGLQAGDMIVSYGGERVFNFRELIALTAAGEPGEMVPLEVVREGSTTQVYLPRGPIGMVGGRRARVDPNDSP